MDVDHHGVYVKFKALFRKIFEEGWEIPRYYSEKLLKFLSDPNNDEAQHLLHSPAFSDLLADSFTNRPKLSPSNKTFIVEIFTELFRNELQFTKLQRQAFDLYYTDKDAAQNNNNRFELRLTFIKLATVLLTHTSGIKATVAEKPWKLVPYLGLHQRPAHVTKVFYEYLSELVWKLDEYEDEATLYEVIRAILKPIHMSEYQTLEVFDTEKEKTYSESVISPLHALLAILSKIDRFTKSKCLIPIFEHCYMIEAPTRKLMIGTRDPDIIYHIAFIDFHLHFAAMKHVQEESGNSESDFLNLLVVRYIRNISLLLSKKVMVEPIMEFILNVNIFMIKNNLYSSLFEWNGEKYEIGDQFVWHLMIPMLTYVTTTTKFTIEECEESIVRKTKLLTEHITKTAYWYRYLLQRVDLKKIAIQNVKQVLKLKGLLKEKQAGTLFYTFFYLLQSFLRNYHNVNASEEMIPNKNVRSSDDMKLLSLSLAAIKMLLTEHSISWYDNLEIICLQNALINLMEQDLPTKQVLQALDLIEMSTRKFLSPEMTLLVESKNGETLSLSGTVAAMRRFIQHEDWEVRDSALSLLLACTDVAFVKYVPLQKLILKNELLVLATQAALTDSEHYVQATALRCLAAAAKIETLWREVMSHEARVYEHLIHILRYNSESAVRTAAATVLTQVYVNQHTNKTFYTCMCKVMLSAALDDLSWEVQLAALEFWKYIIRNQLIDRGMMDDKFPSVTFSKEKRKIIVLDEKEVKRQLAGAMRDLSSLGCLDALHRCLTEDYNVQVIEKAHEMTKKLVDILTIHNFHGEPENERELEKRDSDVAIDLEDIEDITETSDSKTNLNNEANLDTKQDHVPASLKERVHTNEFLETYKQTDYKMLIGNIQNWKLNPQHISGVLDEILEGRTHLEPTYCME